MSTFSLSSIFNKRRSNEYSTFSKVSKRFSSILTLKNKPSNSSSHRKVDTIFPPTIVTSTSADISLISCETEDDDTLITPTTSIAQSIMEEKAVHIIHRDPVDHLPIFPESSTKVEVPEDTTSLAYMVKQQLHDAFDDVDMEIEKEWAQSRHVLIQALKARPRFKYY